MAYAGIDYSLGQSNYDRETGIHFGVISQNSIMPEATDDFEQDYGTPHCPECGNQAIRTALKQAFPDTRFSVTSKSYAGGSSISISHTDGPLLKDVNAITSRFEGAGFDGMTDCKTYNQAVWFGGDLVEFNPGYVRCERSESRALLLQAAERAANETGLPMLTLHPVYNSFVDGNEQCAFTYFADSDVIAHGVSQRVCGGEWYCQIVYQIARNMTTPHQVGVPELPKYQREVAEAATAQVQ